MVMRSRITSLGTTWESGSRFESLRPISMLRTCTYIVLRCA